MKKKALIAMSGGVDSSVCAYLAIKAGYECIGVTMLLYGDNTSDASDAEEVCKKLGIEHITIDFKKEFRQTVIENFVSEYESGRTPNPCIVCNKHLKFGLLLTKAEQMGCDKLVTGHYARTEDNGDVCLKKARDITKDQSYVLYCLNKDKLKKIYLPLGEITKSEAREIAAREGFVTARKSDSQDICFVPDGDYASFIHSYTLRDYPCGLFADSKGNILGEHKGIINYTIGQRKGLGIAFGHPMYVKDKNILSNEVILGDNSELFSNELTACDFNLIEENYTHIRAKIRYNQKEEPCTMQPLGDGRMKIVFETPQRAIARGQSVVVYEDDKVVGGGIIE